MTKHIPNFLTLCNLACGCIGVVQVFNGDIIAGSYFIWAGALFDFFDGFAARMLKKYSAIGADLDSLADLITFCFLPATIIYALINQSLPGSWMAYLGYLLVVFGALRLAKFNNDERQSDTFYGLPVPASAIFVSAYPFAATSQLANTSDLILHPFALVATVLVLSLMMVSDIKLLSLKFKNFDFKENFARYFVIVISTGLLLFLNVMAFPFIIIAYVLTSAILNNLK